MNSVVFWMGIAFALIMAGIARYVVAERVSGLKHLQVISGMQLKAYWLACFLFDWAKLNITIITGLIMFAICDMGLTASNVPLVLLPFGLLPFSYVFSFLFTSDSAASLV